MTVYAYSRVPAFNPNTNPASVAKSASGSVYDIGDTGFTTPLNLTLVATNTVTTTLISDANGMFPDFTLVDRTQCVFKAGTQAFVLTTTTPIPGPTGPTSTVPGPAGPATTDASLLTAGTVADARLPVRLSDTALSATFVPKWKPTTAYTLGQQVTSPNGDTVAAIAAHTSGASFTPANWSYAAISNYFNNVKAYGAKGDGTTDDTAAIQAAHDALPAQGGRIHFPHGKYLVSSTITISKPVTLSGEGSGDHTGGQGSLNTGTTYTPTAQGSVVLTTSQTIDVFVVNASGFAATDLAVVNTASTAPTAGTGIRITKGDCAHLTRVRTAGFWNNISYEQSEYPTITDCLFIDPVNYGLWLRNTVTPDAGDMSILGSVFSFSGSVSRTAAAAIRWESGGGLKMTGCKINMGPGGGIGKFTYGLNLAAGTNVSTSVFAITGNSFENTTAAAILARPQDATGQISTISIGNNEFANCGVSIDLEGTSAKPFYNIAIGANVHQNVTQGVVLKYASGAVVSSQKIGAVAGSGGVLIDVGCSSMRVHRQMILGNSTGNMITNNSSVTFSDHTTPPVDIDWHDKRHLPAITSTSTYVNLWTVPIAAYATGFIDLKVTALVQGKGSGSITAKRSFIRGSSGASTVAIVGTDTTVGFTFDINFDTTSSVGNIVVQIRLNATTGGTDMNGSATLDMTGDIAGLTRN